MSDEKQARIALHEQSSEGAYAGRGSEFDHSARKAKLVTELTQAYDAWRCTTDDKQRRLAEQKALGALLSSAYAEGLPFELLKPIVDLAADLPHLLKPCVPSVATRAWERATK